VRNPIQPPCASFSAIGFVTVAAAAPLGGAVEKPPGGGVPGVPDDAPALESEAPPLAAMLPPAGAARPPLTVTMTSNPTCAGAMHT
jgi:hypothetical protein